MGGEDALTSYWREALMGILKASPMLGILAIPFGIVAYFFYREKWEMPVYQSIQKVRVAFVTGVSFLVYWMALELGKTVDADYFQEYTEFYDPTIVIQDMGVTAMVQRDISFEMEKIADEVLMALGWEHKMPETGNCWLKVKHRMILSKAELKSRLSGTGKTSTTQKSRRRIFCRSFISSIWIWQGWQSFQQAMLKKNGLQSILKDWCQQKPMHIQGCSKAII